MPSSLYMTGGGAEGVVRSVHAVEAGSKIATLGSVMAIVLLQMAFHPDGTGTLRALAVLAFAVGWFAGRSDLAHAGFLIAAAVAPALLRLFTGREGTVLDMVWLAGMTAALVRSVSWTRWDLPGWWRVLLGGWMLALVLVWPVLLLREIGFDPRVFRDTAVINTWSQVSAPLAVHWTLYVVLIQMLGVLWLEWLIGRFKAGPQRVPPAAHGLWIGTTAASLVALYQGTVDPSFLSTPLWAALDRAAGTLLDANAFGIAAAVAASTGALAVRHLWPAHALPVGVAIFAVNFAGMWMSASRTALLCGVAGSLALALALAIRYAGRGRGRGRMARAAAACSAVVLLALGLAWAGGGPLQRLSATPPDARALWERDGYGPPAVEMFRDHPLTGVGPGSYSLLLQDAPSVRTLPFDNAQNWWRHQLAELGLLGGAALLLWSLLLVRLIVWDRALLERRIEAATIRTLLLAIGVVSLVGMPTQHPYVLLWFFFLVAWLASTVSTADRSSLTRTRAGWWVVAASAVAFAAVHAGLAFGSLSVTGRAIAAEREYATGAYAPQQLEDGTVFRWTRERARFIWPARGRWLVVRMWVSHPDVREIPVRVSLSTACGAIFDEPLRTPQPVTIGVELPEDLDAVQAMLEVSRTWRPAAGDDNVGRRLGVGITTRFAEDGEDALGQIPIVPLPVCPGSASR